MDPATLYVIQMLHGKPQAAHYDFYNIEICEEQRKHYAAYKVAPLTWCVREHDKWTKVVR
jgi:hypothetical protein